MALRAVQPSEVSAEGRSASPLSVLQASESGDERATLVAMRRRVATAIDDPDTSSRDLAALTKRIREIVHEIKAWDARVEEEGKSRGPVADEAFDASAL